MTYSQSILAQEAVAAKKYSNGNFHHDIIKNHKDQLEAIGFIFDDK